MQIILNYIKKSLKMNNEKLIAIVAVIAIFGTIVGTMCMIFK